MKLEEDIAGSPAEPDDLLDGLAGRGVDEPTGHDGARLRAALRLAATSPQASAPAWKDIVAAARPAAATASAPSRINAPAANHWRWQRVASGSVALAALVFGAGLWVLSPQEQSTEGMRGKSSAEGAVWRTEQPVQAADALAGRLRRAGARVTQLPIGLGVLVQVECKPDATSAVNEELAPLQAAVDASGRLDIRVLPSR